MLFLGEIIMENYAFQSLNKNVSSEETMSYKQNQIVFFHPIWLNVHKNIYLNISKNNFFLCEGFHIQKKNQL